MSDAHFSKPDELWTSEAADRASVTFPRCSGSKERPAKGVHWSFPRRNSSHPYRFGCREGQNLAR